MMLFKRVSKSFFYICNKAKFYPYDTFTIQNWKTAVIAPLSTTSYCGEKLFVDNENQFAHEILETSLKKYQIFNVNVHEHLNNFAYKDDLPSIILNPPDGENISSTEVAKAFCLLTVYCKRTGTCLSDDRFKAFSRLLCQVLHQMSDDEIFDVLRHLASLPIVSIGSVRAQNFIDIWNTLDLECCHRAVNWNTDTLLMVCDAWYALRLAKICEFVGKVLWRLSRKVKNMSPEHLVHTMFFCNIMRKSVEGMVEFEVNMARCIDDLSLQEIGVMAMGFFKTQTRIRSAELVEQIYDRLTKELAVVEDITLVSILKILRYSSKMQNTQSMIQLLDKIRPEIGRLSLLSCLHVALLGSDIQVCHDSCLELVLQRLHSDLPTARLKDFERFCFVIGLFNYNSVTGIEKTLCAEILKELKMRVDEIVEYPRCFPRCLHFLSINGFYDMEMISNALDPRFLQHAYGDNMCTQKELFQLDSFVEINLASENYNGHRLSDRARQKMGKLIGNYIPDRKYRLNATDRFLLDVKETIDSIISTTFKHVLPHFERPDIIICYDNKRRKAVDISMECPEDYTGVILGRRELLGTDEAVEDIETVVVTVAGPNNVVKPSKRHTGLFDLKLKQLNILGHKSIVINIDDWKDLELPKDRENFIKRKLLTVLNV